MSAALRCTGAEPAASEHTHQLSEASGIVPDRLRVEALPGGNGVLEMVALTLRQGPEHLELYAALQNRGDTPACHAALSVELFDATEQSLAAGISGLLTEHFYRLTDGSDRIAACIGPSELSMAALTDFDANVALDDVSLIVYRCPYFALDVTPSVGLRVEDVRAAGQRYQGVLVNGFAVPVANPSVSIFPATQSGRPLGLIMASDTMTLMPGGRWEFTTDSFAERASGYAAYPAGAL